MHAGGWQHRETDSRKPNQRRQASELRCPGPRRRWCRRTSEPGSSRNWWETESPPCLARARAARSQVVNRSARRRAGISTRPDLITLNDHRLPGSHSRDAWHVGIGTPLRTRPHEYAAARHW